MDDLLGYLDVSGPEYEYLGHFRQRQFLAQGHNEGWGDLNAQDRATLNRVQAGEPEQDTTGSREFGTGDRATIIPPLTQDKAEYGGGGPSEYHSMGATNKDSAGNRSI